MQMNMDEVSNQGEELGVRAHPGCGCTTPGSAGPQSSRASSLSSVYHSRDAAWFVSIAVEARAPI